MTTFDEIRDLVDAARTNMRLADRAYTDDELDRADDFADNVRELIDRARCLVDKHRPAVAYQTVGRGLLVSLDEHAPTEWVRIWDESRGSHATVRWSQVEEAYEMPADLRAALKTIADRRMAGERL